MFDDLQVRERLRIALEKNTQLEEELNTTKEEVRYFLKKFAVVWEDIRFMFDFPITKIKSK